MWRVASDFFHRCIEGFATSMSREAPSGTVPAPASRATPPSTNKRHAPARGYACAMLYCIGATLLGTLLHETFVEANLVLIYLLAVVLATVQYGRGPGIVASFLAVLAFDIFMVLP